jgi:hypothetical protein
MGRLHEIPEVLFWRIEHAETSQNAFDLSERLEWFDATRSGDLDLPNWRMVLELLRTVKRAGLPPTERDRCSRVVARYVYDRAPSFGRDLFEAVKLFLRRSPMGARVVEGLKRLYHSRTHVGHGRRMDGIPSVATSKEGVER